MILYGSSMSPFVRKVLAFAGEKGVELEVQPTGFPNPSAEFLEASPFRKMPALRDGDFTLADSSAIIHYLEAKHPDPALIPSDPQLRGKTIWYEEFADTILFSCGAKIFFNMIVAPLSWGGPGDEEAATQAEINDLPPILDYLEKVAPATVSIWLATALRSRTLRSPGPSRISATRRRGLIRIVIRALLLTSIAYSRGQACAVGRSRGGLPRTEGGLKEKRRASLSETRRCLLDGSDP